MGFVLNVLACLVSIFIGIYTYMRWKFEYWRKEGVPYIKPTFPLGSEGNPLKNTKTFAEILQQHYHYFKSQGYKYGGYYSLASPIFLPAHPEYVKAVLSKDFTHFMSRGVYYNEKSEPLSGHLLSLEGERWKKLRTKLTPTFTSGKMKMMFHILIACSDQLVTAVNKMAENQTAVDVKEILGSFTTDVIGSCAFGIECNSFNENESEFRKYGRKFFSPLSKFQLLRNTVAFTLPALGRFLGISTMNRETTKFFLNAVKETVDYRERKSVKRNDFMQLLINLKNNMNDSESHDTKGIDKFNLTIEQMAAQTFVFFVAGFETSSTTMTYSLLELAQNQEIQDKVRNEILDALANNDGEFTYESMMKTNYLSQVVNESLRKYPAVPVLPRKCVEDYKIPGTNSTVKKGTRVFVPVFALHRDPEFFPDPEKFDPERFNEINKSKILAFSYLPFGEGPRNCIGSRFGLMQTKVGLSVLLKHFRFTINKKTTVPVQFNKNSFILVAKSGVWLNVEKID